MDYRCWLELIKERAEMCKDRDENSPRNFFLEQIRKFANEVEYEVEHNVRK